MQDKHGLLSAPINQVLSRMTLPMVFGLVAILMFNLVDTYFISLLGTHALAAISFTFPVTFGVSCITMGVGMAISANVGRFLGQGDNARAAGFSTHGILLAIILVCAAASLGYFTIYPLFHMLGAKDNLISLIEQYMQIWYLTIPLLVIPMTGNSAIRASGDTKTPAKIMLISGLINGLLDPLLIFGLGPFPELGIQGAAIASGISWLMALIASLWVLIRREKLLTKLQLSWLLHDWQQVLKIGAPASFSNAMNPLCGAILMMLLAQYGATSVAAYGAAQRVESLMLLVMMSLASVMTPFIAQNMGAEQVERSFKGLFKGMRFSLIFQFGLFIIMVPLSIPISNLFSQEAEVQTLLWHYLLVVPISYGCQGMVMLLVSSLNAMHLPLKAFGWNFARLFIFNLPFAWIGAYSHQVEGLFIGIAVGNSLSGLLAYCYALRLRKRSLERLDNPAT
ncbi:MAG: MATE family efflux transporter [Vibrio sp.]